MYLTKTLHRRRKKELITRILENNMVNFENLKEMIIYVEIDMFISGNL